MYKNYYTIYTVCYIHLILSHLLSIFIKYFYRIKLITGEKAVFIIISIISLTMIFFYKLIIL